MKSVVFLLALLLLTSCDKSENIPVTTVELVVEANNELRHFLGNNPIEGGYSITKQAKSYVTSEIRTDEISGELQYIYAPENDFIGLEIVEITLRTSPGNDKFTKSLIVLQISVE
ncbi:MAG: hypothetical protein AB3N18_16365 [Allomuricauda sp.]